MSYIGREYGGGLIAFRGFYPEQWTSILFAPTAWSSLSRTFEHEISRTPFPIE